MSTLNSLAANPAGNRRFLTPHIPSFAGPLSFRITPSPSRFSIPAVKASSQNSNPKPPNRSENLFKSQINNNSSDPIPLKSTVIATVTAAAFFLAGSRFSPKPSIAAPISPPPTVETAEKEPCTDIDELKGLIETRVNSRKIPEAIEILDKLTSLEPDEIEWRLLRGNLLALNGEFQSARNVFHEMLNENPGSVKACQGLVNVNTQEASIEELKRTEERVLEAIRLVGNDDVGLRSLKLLLAQIRVLEGKYEEALVFYEELEKEEPRDFRVYLCQGLVYGLLKRQSEAEASFEKYKRLVPEGHFRETYLDDSLNAAKFSAQKVENKTRDS